MRVGKYKGLLQSTALASLPLLAAFPGFTQEAASIQQGITPAQTIRDYYGDNDPNDEEFSSSLLNSVSIGGMSADGSTFVGSVFRSYSKGIYSGFVWTADGGVEPVGERDPRHMHAAAFDDLLGMSGQEPVPEFVGDGKILESLVVGKVVDARAETISQARVGKKLYVAPAVGLTLSSSANATPVRPNTFFGD